MCTLKNVGSTGRRENCHVSLFFCLVPLHALPCVIVEDLSTAPAAPSEINCDSHKHTKLLLEHIQYIADKMVHRLLRRAC